MNCPVCDRPRATPGEMNAVLASSHVCDSPACAQDKCWRSSNTDVHILDCNAHRVDWRERAAAAESLVTASQAAAVTSHKARIEAEERAGRLEATLREIAFRPLAVPRHYDSEDLIVAIGSLVETAKDALPRCGPQFGNFVCGEAKGHNGPHVGAALPRNAAERGEAFARTGDVGVLVAGLDVCRGHPCRMVTKKVNDGFCPACRREFERRGGA